MCHLESLTTSWECTNTTHKRQLTEQYNLGHFWMNCFELSLPRLQALKYDDLGG
jgi:hypothetical protein